MKNTGAQPTVPRLFCENTTIRGIGKLAKHRQYGLRVLWIVFLVSMAAILGYGSISLIMEFLMYKTTILTKEKFNTVPDFPSVTFCNHHPFSEEGVKAWEKNEIISPADFNKELRRFVNQTLSAGSVKDAYRLFYSDKISTYYESIGPDKAQRIGHQKDSMVYCVVLTKDAENVRVGHAEECGIHLKLLRHPRYFNCYTATVQKTHTKKTTALGIIVHLGQKPTFTGKKMGFMHDVLNQAHGLRVVMHAEGTLPNMNTDGYNVEAGKFAELRFETEFWKQYDRPTERCTPPEKLKKVTHDSVDYEYTEHACQQREKAEHLLERCNCVTTEFVTDKFGNPNPYQYCSNFSGSAFRTFLNNFDCVKKQLSAFEEKNLDDKEERACEKPCEFYRYEAHLSTSKWAPSPWQLKWLMTLSDTWKDMESNNQTLKRKARSDLARFLTADDLSNATNMDPSQIGEFTEDDNIFVVVTRRSFATMQKEEVLSLSTYALLSRIGGFSSLSLGITFATLFEIIEFCCLLCGRERKSLEDRRSLRKKSSETKLPLRDMENQATPMVNSNSNNNNNNNNNNSAEILGHNPTDAL